MPENEVETSNLVQASNEEEFLMCLKMNMKIKCGLFVCLFQEEN